MGWIQEQFEKRSERSTNASPTPENTAIESHEHDLWNHLAAGFRRDVDEFQRLGGNGSFENSGELQCRILNSTADVAVHVAADLSARTIEYRYESKQRKTAVPENGILTIRPSAASVALYSADQQLNPEEARRLILEPLLVPSLPRDLADTGA